MLQRKPRLALPCAGFRPLDLFPFATHAALVGGLGIRGDQSCKGADKMVYLGNREILELILVVSLTTNGTETRATDGTETQAEALHTPESEAVIL